MGGNGREEEWQVSIQVLEEGKKEGNCESEVEVGRANEKSSICVILGGARKIIVNLVS